jgi:hypothetical protein
MKKHCSFFYIVGYIPVGHHFLLLNASVGCETCVGVFVDTALVFAVHPGMAATEKR